MNKKKIFILCATKSGLDLIKLISSKYKIGCVITAKTYKNSTSERISAKKFCKENKIRCKEIKNYSNLDEIKKFLLQEKIDILICISWQRLIPLWLIKKEGLVCIGAHGSHQGMYLGRGRSPINWAILSGKKIFEISLFLIKNEEADSGSEIFSKKFKINYTDDVASIYVKCHLILSKMIFNFLENKKTKMKKYELEKSRFLPKINPKDGFIDWNRSAIDLFNFIRSKSIPYPNAFTMYKNIKIEILSSKPINDFIIEKAKAGTIIMLLSNDDLLVQTKKGMLIISIEKKYLRYMKPGIKFRSANFKNQIKNIIKSHYELYPANKLNKLISNLSK
jgi:methionyl-tRNA formyltransferase